MLCCKTCWLIDRGVVFLLFIFFYLCCGIWDVCLAQAFLLRYKEEITIGYYHYCQALSFPVEFRYFNTLAMGCFSCPRVEATTIMWFLAPGVRNFHGEPQPKMCIFTPRNVIIFREVPLITRLGWFWEAIRRALPKPGNPGDCIEYSQYVWFCCYCII